MNHLQFKGVRGSVSALSNGARQEFIQIGSRAEVGLSAYASGGVAVYQALLSAANYGYPPGPRTTPPR